VSGDEDGGGSTTSKFNRVRSTVLFVVGLAGIGYETLAEGGERPTLLLLFAAMCGLPAFLGLDERRRKNGDKP
jgi:hypothetical protein